jgi:hypothetical protein
MTRLVACLFFVATIAILTFVWLHGSARTALACSVGMVTLEQAANDADAAAIVFAESVRGPENTAPPLGPVATVTPLSRTRPVDLTGYGATLRVHTPIFGELPPQFDVDVAVRQGMEQGLRMIESGFVPPCHVGSTTAHYIPGQYYLVLLEQTESGWNSWLSFNYRVEGPDLLTTKVYQQEQRVGAGPWEIELRGPLYERFFAGAGHKIYPSSDAPPGVVVSPHDEVWRLDGPRISLGDYVAALRFARTQPSIRPPTTGDGGLQDHVP